MKPGARYYTGGFRIVAENNWPCRVARKPGKAYAAMLKKDEPPDVPEYLTGADAMAFRVQRANTLIQKYADAMGLTLKEAKCKIDAQRLHVLANPVRDLTQEYDL